MSEKQTRNLDNEFDNATVKKEVEKLLKDDITQLSPELVNRLRSKYNDDTVLDSVMEYFAERRNKVIKVSNIFLDAFENKYKDSFGTMSLSKFMKRALKYKKRYELTDEEFDEVKNTFESRIYNNTGNLQANVAYPNTNLGRTLGYPIVESTTRFRPTNTDEYANLQDILKLYQTYKTIHSHIVIQTMLYKNLAPEAMNGEFDRYKCNPSVYVHPLIAAFFLPKIKKMDERMLYANIAGIINTKYNGQRIITQPDYELFHAMVVDPSDTVCDESSPIKDLKNRIEVQVQLWNNVYNLRGGNYYNTSSVDFLAYLDKCRVVANDNPDLVYLGDEGVILRRLFNIFSFRPIIVRTQPIFGVITSNPLNLPINTDVITAIPYITFKLPIESVANLNGTQYKLDQALHQTQFHMENGSFVPKATQIIDTRGPLVFYVPRRSVGLPLDLSNPNIGPLILNNFKSTTIQYNNINRTEIDFDYTINIDSDSIQGKVHYLRSVLIIDVEIVEDMKAFTGHFALLFSYTMNDNDNEIIGNYPIGVHAYLPNKANQIDTQNNKDKSFPIRTVTEDPKDTISKFGTIFIYASNN